MSIKINILKTKIYLIQRISQNVCDEQKGSECGVYVKSIHV